MKIYFSVCLCRFFSKIKDQRSHRHKMDTELGNFIFCQVWTGGYPCVFKIGHAHGGLGKVKVENDAGFEVKKRLLNLKQ